MARNKTASQKFFLKSKSTKPPKKKNMTIIFVTHNIVLAKSISDRIIIMKDGKIVDDSIKVNGDFTFNSSYSKILYDNATYIKKKTQRS